MEPGFSIADIDKGIVDMGKLLHLDGIGVHETPEAADIGNDHKRRRLSRGKSKGKTNKDKEDR